MWQDGTSGFCRSTYRGACARPADEDCGIANVSIGPSGGEICGDKKTGRGREAGSDTWKATCAGSTKTIDCGPTLLLAQGVMFDLGPVAQR